MLATYNNYYKKYRYVLKEAIKVKQVHDEQQN